MQRERLRTDQMELLFLVSSLCYLLTIQFSPYRGSYIVKSIPILSLAALVLTGSPSRLIFFGLLFSAGGDIALDLDRGRYFVHGLGLFLVAHIFYTAAFLQSSGTADRLTFTVITILAVYAVGMSLLLRPKLGNLAVPVYLYIAVITAMGISASFRSPLVLTGALIFMLSDSMIAINKFLQPIPGSNYWIMITYYLAQYLIAKGTS